MIATLKEKISLNKNKKGLFLVDEHLWNVFIRTGNIEAYLLLKQLEKKDGIHESYNQLSQITSQEVSEMKME